MAITAASCSEDSIPTIKPEQAKIKGVLGSCYQVVDKEYSIENNGMFNVLSVEIQRISDNLPFTPQLAGGYGDDDKSYNVGFGIEMLDKKGSVISTKQATGTGFSGPYSSDDVIAIINLLKDETGIIRWSVDDESLKKLHTFRITSALKENSLFGSSEQTTNDRADDAAGDNNSSKEWDSVLDEYEKLADKYISLYKKAQNGDISAMTDYVGVLESAEKLQTKLEKAKSDLTTAQASRLTKIISKMANAAL